MEEGPKSSVSVKTEVSLNNSNDEIDETQVPCNTPVEKIQKPKNGPRQHQWSPCCCGGTLKSWAIVIGVYEISMYGILLTIKMLPTEKFEVPSSIDTAISYIIHIEEFVTYGLGITTGFVSILTLCTKFRILCILHFFLSLVMAILLLTLVGLVSVFHRKPFKWVRMLGYTGNSALSIYIALYSIAFFKKTKRKYNMKRRERKSIGSQNDIKMSLINPRLSFSDHEKSDVEEFIHETNELGP